MGRAESIEIKIVVAGLSLLFLLVVGGWIIGARMESRAYNRLTGADTSTWDAMFLELRVQDAPREAE